MKIKLKTGQKLPRMICIPHCIKKDYRALQRGDAVNIDMVVEKYLVDGGYCEIIPDVKKKGSVHHGHDSTD